MGDFNTKMCLECFYLKKLYYICMFKTFVQYILNHK